MADALTLMKGNEHGHGKGLTTFPDSEDEELRALHAECLVLEAAGKVTRHIDKEAEDAEYSGPRHVLWMPVA